MTWISIPGPKHTFLLVAVEPEASNFEKKFPSFGLYLVLELAYVSDRPYSSGCAVVCKQKSPGFNFRIRQTDDPSA